MAGNVNGTAHAWNAVNVSGKWYYVDATFANTMGMRADYLLFGSDRRADVYGIGIVSGDYGTQMSDDALVIEDTGDNNDNKADGDRNGYIIVIAVAVIVIVIAAGWCALRKKKS